MEKILMIASESSHFLNFHIPYIDYLLDKGVCVYTASNGELNYRNVKHIRLGLKKRFVSFANIRVIFKLVNLMKKECFDAVYTNSTLAGFVGRTALILSGQRDTACRHICHGYLFSDDGSLRSRIYLLFEKLTAKRTDLLAVMNNEDLEIAEKHSLGRKIVFINGMGLDTKRFPELSPDKINAQRETLGAKPNEVLFLCVGELSKRKNQRCIIEAFAKLKRSDCRLFFAGGGSELDECRALARETGKSDRIIFLGHCEDTNILYRCCDCVISASRFEGLPFNLMEAMYCKKQVIVSDVKGNRDLSGRLYPYGAADRLAELMESFDREFAAEPLDTIYMLDNAFEHNIKLLSMLES